MESTLTFAQVDAFVAFAFIILRLRSFSSFLITSVCLSLSRLPPQHLELVQRHAPIEVRAGGERQPHLLHPALPLRIAQVARQVETVQYAREGEAASDSGGLGREWQPSATKR